MTAARLVQTTRPVAQVSALTRPPTVLGSSVPVGQSWAVFPDEVVNERRASATEWTPPRARRSARRSRSFTAGEPARGRAADSCASSPLIALERNLAALRIGTAPA
jgi:hypothetical protein